MERITGAYAQKNEIRFSSKYFDNETQLSFYGFRYYSASMGRFINRDPLEEQGGWNLYRNLNYSTTNPYFGSSGLGSAGWLTEWSQKQDSLTRNASFSHSTEEIQFSNIRNSGFIGTYENNKKFYSANAGVTVGQGGSKGLEFDSPDLGRMAYTGSSSPGYRNKNTNLYAFVANDPINLYDPLGLYGDDDEDEEEEAYQPTPEEIQAAIEYINEQITYINKLIVAYNESYKQLKSEGTVTEDWGLGPFSMKPNASHLNQRVDNIMEQEGIINVVSGTHSGGEITINYGNPNGNLTERIQHEEAVVHEGTHNQDWKDLVQQMGENAARNYQYTMDFSYRTEINAYTQQRLFIQNKSIELKQ